MNAKPETKEVRTGHLIAYSSLIIAILYAIHLFLILDDSVVKQLLINSKQKPSENAIGVIKNSFQFTGVMYVIANLTGVIAIWNRHTYLWWFMFAVFASQILYNLVNINAVFEAILDVKSMVNILPLTIVLIMSFVLAVYMLVVSIKRKSTFNR
ncbi:MULTISPECIES: hypothetical protein [Staphylococcus]|jgi:hypothetical protein|uniref:Membrane spanning protein n=1 Tax=Staphylococcus nepalensis TaxID=214473 RepID=A0A291JMH7_9STAP|nr:MULTISPECIES: hypothetical protein [Staphylococcus]VDG67742.1 Uncharacterised protein [Lacrimispora indolis]ATH60780.1 hypothetical protein BJD96_10950 [Staphylococcus nepalensis]ATH65810.1 hypothetical protein BJG89_10960 [Staphylococcus nepalensis]AWI45201.1 hypothetical protein BJG88_10840 [Staphylococcus nepalensis]MBO1206649.1 hypothetical protein [Staphylococcus nepalensis]